MRSPLHKSSAFPTVAKLHTYRRVSKRIDLYRTLITYYYYYNIYFVSTAKIDKTHGVHDVRRSPTIFFLRHPTRVESRDFRTGSKSVRWRQPLFVENFRGKRRQKVDRPERNDRRGHPPQRHCDDKTVRRVSDYNYWFDFAFAPDRCRDLSGRVFSHLFYLVWTNIGWLSE